MIAEPESVTSSISAASFCYDVILCISSFDEYFSNSNFVFLPLN